MEYLSNGLELQIKMAQGAKPGDWGPFQALARVVSCIWSQRVEPTGG